MEHHYLEPHLEVDAGFKARKAKNQVAQGYSDDKEETECKASSMYIHSS